MRYQVTLENNQTRSVHQVDISEEIKELKDTMNKLMMAQAIDPKVCEFCESPDHKPDECPSLFEDVGDVNAISGCASDRAPQKPRQHRYGLMNDVFSWRDDHNFQKKPTDSRGQQRQQSPRYDPLHRRMEAQNPPREKPKKSREEIVAQIDDTFKKSGKQNEKRFEQTETQLTQIATYVYELKKANGILCSQVIQNPEGGVNDVTLRTGRAVGSGADTMQKNATKPVAQPHALTKTTPELIAQPIMKPVTHKFIYL